MTIPIHATTIGITQRTLAFRRATKCSPVRRPMAPHSPMRKITPATTGPATRVQPRAEEAATSMPPMAGSTPRSVFLTAMAAAAVPGTPLTERAAVPKRIRRTRTASDCSTVSRLTRMVNKSFFMLAAFLLLAQPNAPTAQFNTQGVTPPPGSNPSPAKMTFFVTSVGMGKGGNLGGLAGADAHCQALAAAVGAGRYNLDADLTNPTRPRPAATHPPGQHCNRHLVHLWGA